MNDFASKSQNTTTSRATIASVLLHLFVAVFLIWASNHAQSIRVPEKQVTWIELEPTQKEKESTRAQVVQTLAGTQNEDAKKDAFLGEKTQSVDRQTVSRQKTTVIGNQHPGQSQSPEKTAERTIAKPSAHTKKNVETESQTGAGPLSKFGLPLLPYQRHLNIKEGSEKTAQELQEQQEQEQKLEEQQKNWAQQGQQLQEYVKGIHEGEQTLLNTKEFVYYGYFSRIREKLDRAWVPILREKVSMWYRGGRHLASDIEHVTKVLVVLNETGEITKVQMMSESGTRVLDEAAVKAFNEAGPFPNPPKGLVDAKSEIEIPWEFVLRT